MKKMTIITPTGDRYEALRMAIYHMKRQTFLLGNNVLEWIVVDDGATQAASKALSEHSNSELASLGIVLYHIRLENTGTGPKSLATNVINGMAHMSGEKLLIWEDDDCYMPGYLDDMWERLEHADVVGTVWQKYYHLPSRSYRVYRNRGSALCSTGLTTRAYGHLLESATYCWQNNNKGIDARFWESVQKEDFLVDIFEPERDFVIGIKGMPGREGIGVGHRPRRFVDDPTCKVLRQWVGDRNLSRYLPFTGDGGGL